MNWQTQELLASAFLAIATATLAVRAVATGRVRSLPSGAALGYMLVPAILLPLAVITRDAKFVVALGAWVFTSIVIAYPLFFIVQQRKGDWDDGLGQWLDPPHKQEDQMDCSEAPDVPE